MAQKLSKDSHNRLKQALSTWREWITPPGSEPILISRLGGHTNESYRVSDSKSDWVVRLNSTKADGGINRRNELLAIEVANSNEIAPDITYHDGEFLILEYLQGDKPTVDDLPAIGKLFTDIHYLKADIEPINLPQHLHNYYEASTPDPDIDNCFSKFNKLAHPTQTTLVLCHQDLTMDNLIKVTHRLSRKGDINSNEQPILVIDWEYAHLSDPAYDLAVFSYTTGLSDAQLTILLDNYQHEEANLKERIHYYELYYALIEILWWFNRGQILDVKIAGLNQLLDQALSA